MRLILEVNNIVNERYLFGKVSLIVYRKRLGDAVFFFKKSDNPFLFRFYFCFPSICRAINLYIFSCLYLVVTSPLC